ncbi:MAG: BrnT family toxin [Acidobacteria bacterium]|nr:BrnT family toxin [Acidobacteriota bacterium]
MRFAWDERKSEANLRERGFDFAFASLIFDGATVEVEDRRPPRHPANHLGTKEQST